MESVIFLFSKCCVGTEKWFGSDRIRIGPYPDRTGSDRSGSASLVRRGRGIVLWNVLLSQNVNSSRQGCGSLSFLIDPDSTSSFFKIQIFILRSGILNLKKNRVTLYFDLNFDFLYIFSVMMLEAEFLSSKQTTFSV